MKGLAQNLLVIWALLVAEAFAQSGNLAGRVIYVTPEARTVDELGNIRKLARREGIFAGDTIETNKQGMVQIRMIDSAIIALGCNSSVKIEDYWYEESPNTDQVTLRLLSGRIRTITGEVGAQNPERYYFLIGDTRVEIRGTDFEVLKAGDGILYFGNYDGGITIVTGQGTLRLGIGGDGDFARVEPGQAPELLIQSPQQLDPAIVAANPELQTQLSGCPNP